MWRTMKLVRSTVCIASLMLVVAAVPLRAEPLLRHVHGLAYSADGTALLVPSHFGLSAFRDGRWSDLDGPIHDFAGFSVARTAMYASGHPTPGTPLPDPLGLVKTTDGGGTWQVLTLGGQTDFHVIAAGFRSNAIYVLSEAPLPAMPKLGVYLTRDEGRTWRRSAARGLEGEVLALAAHPVEAETVAAATDRGLYLSRDAGDRFRRVAGKAATGVAFDPRGKVLHYALATSSKLVSVPLERGARRAVDLPGIGLDYVTHIAPSPVDDRVLALATRGRSIYISSDRGSTWRQIATRGDLP